MTITYFDGTLHLVSTPTGCTVTTVPGQCWVTVLTTLEVSDE